MASFAEKRIWRVGLDDMQNLDMPAAKISRKALLDLSKLLRSLDPLQDFLHSSFSLSFTNGSSKLLAGNQCLGKKQELAS